MRGRGLGWLRRGMVTAVAAGVVGALPPVVSSLAAQEGNQSEVSGATTSSSTAASGAFTPPASTAAGNLQGQGPQGGSPGAATPGAVNVPALTSTASAVQGQLATGSFSGVGPGAAVVSLPSGAQGAVAAVMSGEAPPSVLEAALGSGATAAGSAELAAAVHGLLANPTPARLGDALRAFNEIVASSDPAFLMEPTPEFVAIRGVLDRMAGALSAAAEAGRD